jgi:hypothetical protein
MACIMISSQRIAAALIGHLPDRRAPAQVVPDEYPVPADLLRLASQPRDHDRIGKIAKERWSSRRTSSRRVRTFGQ